MYGGAYIRPHLPTDVATVVLLFPPISFYLSPRRRMARNRIPIDEPGNNVRCMLNKKNTRRQDAPSVLLYVFPRDAASAWSDVARAVIKTKSIIPAARVPPYFNWGRKHRPSLLEKYLAERYAMEVINRHPPVRVSEYVR